VCYSSIATDDEGRTQASFAAGAAASQSTPIYTQSDNIWRIDLQDDHESCHPVGLEMT